MPTILASTLCYPELLVVKLFESISDVTIEIAALSKWKPLLAMFRGDAARRCL